jgi:predicted nucleic acid-binding protein
MKIFIDTSAWVALENRKDIHYEQALLFRDEIKNKRMRSLKDKGLLHVVRVTEEIEEAAWEIFERFNRDKFWSFTDCTSKTIMDSLDIKETFSFDRNFEQMGFIRRP